MHSLLSFSEITYIVVPENENFCRSTTGVSRQLYASRTQEESAHGNREAVELRASRRERKEWRNER